MSSPEPTVSGSGVIHSDTLAVARSAPAAEALTRSLSVGIPTARSPSVTTVDPTPRSNMRRQISDTVSEPGAVRTSVVIRSPTVRTLALSAPFVAPMARIVASKLGDQLEQDQHPGNARQP